jgi:hypothetical protein
VVISAEIALHFSLQNYGFSRMQHSVFFTCNFLQKVLAKNSLDMANPDEKVRIDTVFFEESIVSNLDEIIILNKKR